MTRRKDDSPQKAAMSKMMQGYREFCPRPRLNFILSLGLSGCAIYSEISQSIKFMDFMPS